MTFIPHTAAEMQEMLARIGVENLRELFEDIPERYRFPSISLPRPASEIEIMAELRQLSEMNSDVDHMACFLGAGAYHHYIPSVVGHILGRSEFYTAYTPYQPEVSQGTLQSIFEYQTMICELTGMEVSNASHYDGATAVAEAVIMALSVARGRRDKVVLSPTVHPEYRETVRTYMQGVELEIVGDDRLENDLPALASLIDDNTACVVVQNPDFLGRIADLTALAETAHAHKALLVVVCNPISLGMLKTPAAYGADIACGEGQPLGIPLNFGGPYLGFFACKQEQVRRMAGRLVGQTLDARGERGYVLTLSTREQHIRRERATSNICTNQGLLTLAACVYLAALGKCGLRQVANLCYQKAHYAAKQIAALDGFEVDMRAPFFHEFVVKCPAPVRTVNDLLLEHGILGGLDLGTVYPELENHMLLCVTEMNSAEEINDLVDVLGEGWS
ncbi:MAG: aminomethyl-transferring glycine dehydrogenase subunit GcvPA [Chloroflexi bacterium]|jgi:glycine dehydrogenase subunit 1|nr:aminomethyl-transferring glycine dehydrogenase subunit GcvPA [Chloroflexota bacterium]